MKCVVLLNSKPYFFSYVDWLLRKSYLWDFKLSGIYAKSPQLVESHFARSPGRRAKGYKFFDGINSALQTADVAISLGYWKILTQEQIAQVPYGIINFQHSYKLKYKGRHSASWVIRNKEKVHGSTMHYINEELDGGSIIDTKAFKIKKHATAEEIFTQANITGLSLLKKNFKNIIDKKTIPLTQPSKKSYTFKEKDLSHEIPLDDLRNPDKVYREVRALTFNGCSMPFFKVARKKIYLSL